MWQLVLIDCLLSFLLQKCSALVGSYIKKECLITSVMITIYLKKLTIQYKGCTIILVGLRCVE